MNSRASLFLFFSALLLLSALSFFLLNALYVEGYRTPKISDEWRRAESMSREVELLGTLLSSVRTVDETTARLVGDLRDRYAGHAGPVTARLDGALRGRIEEYAGRVWIPVVAWARGERDLSEGERDALRKDAAILRKMLVHASRLLYREQFAERRAKQTILARGTALVLALLIVLAAVATILLWRSRRVAPGEGSVLPDTSAEQNSSSVAADSEREHLRDRLILKRYREILDSMPAGIVAVDAASNTVLFVNAPFRDWSGIDRELIGEPVSIFAGQGMIDPSAVGKLALEGRTFWREKTIVGDTILYLVRDISEQERLAGRLLNSERLISIGEIASKVTHEIRNPLSTIKMNAEYVADHATDLSPEELSAAVALIVREVARLEEITDRYMGMVRYRADEEAPERIPLVAALNDLVAFHRGEFDRRRIELRVAPIPETDIALSLNSFREVMLNLLKNAWEELEDGGRVALSATVDAATVRLMIEDSGRGVPAAEREKIFRNFYTTKPGGTGIGLSHSLKLVNEASGAITVDESTLGGARFTVTIPRVL